MEETKLQLFVRLTFQDLVGAQPQEFVVFFDSDEERSTWRLEFDRKIERLNDEFELGWMTCISPDYTNIDGQPLDLSGMRWTPTEAIDTVRGWYLRALRKYHDQQQGERRSS